MNKRGLSSIIIITIIIALSLIAIGIFWGVINSIITENTEDISNSMGNLRINAKIANIQIKDEKISIIIERDDGGKESDFSLIFKNKLNKTKIDIGKFKAYQKKNIQIPKKEVGFIFQEVLVVITKNEETQKVLDSRSFSFGESLSLFGAKAYFPLDEDFKDYSKNKISGVTANKSLLPNKFLYLKGNSYVQFKKSSILNIGNKNFTLVGWVKLDGKENTNWQFIFGKKGVPYGTKGYALYRKKNTDRLSLHLANYTDNSCEECYTASDTEKLETNKWHHIASIRDFSHDRKGYYYLNGKKKYFNSKLFEGNISSNYDFSIGRNSNKGEYYFKGYVDEIMVFPRVLEEFEIKSIYHLTKKEK